MITLKVTITGRTVERDAGGKVIGGTGGTSTHRVGWDGEWVTDGDPATITAQRNEVAALFPGVEIQDMSIVPE